MPKPTGPCGPDRDRPLGLGSSPAPGPPRSPARSRRRSRSASSAWPRVISQRGLSGTACRKKMMIRPSTAPMPNPSRQPRSIGSSVGSSSTIVASEPERGPQPEGAVDRQVDPAAHPRRDQLVDGRVDRRVFAADPGAGEEAEDGEAPEVPGEGRQERGDQVEAERDREQLLAARAGRSGSRRPASPRTAPTR